MKDESVLITKDEVLSVANAEQYKKPEKELQDEVTVSTEKKKIIRTRKYKNGVVKRDIVGIIKNNRVIWEKGADDKIIQAYKRKK